MANGTGKVQVEATARKRAQRGTPATKCEKCGATKNLQRHHFNIKESRRVMVVCSACHTKIHQKRGDRP